MTCEEIMMLSCVYGGGIAINGNLSLIMFEPDVLPEWAEELLKSEFTKNVPDEYSVQFVDYDEHRGLIDTYNKYLDHRNPRRVKNLVNLVEYRYLLCPNIVHATISEEFESFMEKFMISMKAKYNSIEMDDLRTIRNGLKELATILDIPVITAQQNGATPDITHDTHIKMTIISAFWYIANNTTGCKISNNSIFSLKTDDLPHVSFEFDTSTLVMPMPIFNYSEVFTNSFYSENSHVFEITAAEDIESCIFNYWVLQLKKKISEGGLDDYNALDIIPKEIIVEMSEVMCDMVHMFISSYVTPIAKKMMGEVTMFNMYDHTICSLMTLFAAEHLVEKDESHQIYKPLVYELMYTWSRTDRVSCDIRDILDRSNFWYYDAFGNICCNDGIYEEMAKYVEPGTFITHLEKSLSNYPVLAGFASGILKRYETRVQLRQRVDFDHCGLNSNETNLYTLAYALLMLAEEYAFVTTDDEVLKTEVGKAVWNQLGNKRDKMKPCLTLCFEHVINSFNLVNSKMDYFMKDLAINAIVWNCAMQQIYYMIILAYKEKPFKTDMMFDTVIKGMRYAIDDDMQTVDMEHGQRKLSDIASGEPNREYRFHLIYLAMMNDDMFGHNAACTYCYNVMETNALGAKFYYEWACDRLPNLSRRELVDVISCNTLPTVVYRLAVTQIKKILRKSSGIRSKRFKEYVVKTIDNMSESYRTKETLLPYIAGYFEDAIDTRHSVEFAKYYMISSLNDNMDIISNIRDFDQFGRMLDILQQISLLPGKDSYCKVFPAYYIYNDTRDIRDIIKNI